MKPILFNTEMVRAILEDRKWMTRQVIKPKYRKDEGGFQVCSRESTGERWVEKVDENECGIFLDGSERLIYPPYTFGDNLWVRETWNGWRNPMNAKIEHWYKADEPIDADTGVLRERWRPSIHMPRDTARLFLKVTSVRVEQLQSITAADICAEGIAGYCNTCDTITQGVCADLNLQEECIYRDAHRRMYAKLWDSTIKKKDLPLYGWAANPWVWGYGFERVDESKAEN